MHAAADGERVSVELSGTGIRGGESGASGRRTVVVPPACFYRGFLSGVEYAQAWAAGGRFSSLVRRLPEEDQFEAFPDYLVKAAGPAGHWFYPTCVLDRFPSAEAYQAGYRAFRALHDVVFVLDGEPAPAGQVIPAESLAQLAYEETDLPAGVVQWNPRLAGTGATLVGVDTWVWVDNPVLQVEVTAQIPGLSATVTSVFDRLRVEAEGADAVTCQGTPGTAWVEGATTNCAVVFMRSTANQDVKDGQSLPTVTLTATSRWQASWTSSATPGVNTVMDDPQTVVYTAEIPVAEIQTLVTT